jgi:hypothetical protein
VFQRNFTASFIKVDHLPWGWNQQYHLKSGTLLKDYVTSHSRRQQSSQSPMSEPKISQTRDYFYFQIWEVQKELPWVISFLKCLATSFTLFFLKWNHLLHSHTMIHSKYPLELATLKVHANYNGKQENSLWKTRALQYSF